MTQFSTREVPWMKLGQLVDRPQTAAEAAALSGLDFTVSAEVVRYERSGEMMTMDNRCVIVCDDTDEPLGIVSSGYGIVQYRDAFDFMDQINPYYVAAGSLQKRRQAFMVVEMPDVSINVLGGDDPHSLYAVLRTSHDCTRAIEVMAMPLRGKCMNQLTLQSFSHGATNRWSIKHTSKVQEKLRDASRVHDQLKGYAHAVEETADRLASIQVTYELASTALDRAVPSYIKSRDTVKNRIIEMWNTDPTVGYPGTGWGLVNAVSSYFDWERQGGTAESRFVASLQGQTFQAINRTAAMLLSRA